jgi:hypothetical protein
VKLTLRLSIVLFCMLLAPAAHGWLRIAYEDAVVVQRSELIVVGHLVRGSVIREQSAPGVRQYRALLQITEVLKGVNAENEIPITIYHGLTPVVGWHINEPDEQMDLRSFHRGEREDSIQIFDTGNSADSFSPICADAGEENLWFLRRRSGNYGREPGTGAFGIVDPEDIQALPLKHYFKAYLSNDPEGEIRRQVQLNGDLERRAKRYLDHLEVQRILALPEPEARIEALLPFYINRQWWIDGHDSIVYEARKGITDCGDMSGPYLRRIFDDPSLARLREDVIDIWGDLRFEPSVDALIGVLRENEKFWSLQRLDGDWWNRDSQSELTRTCRQKYGEVYSSVIALGKIGDPRAMEEIQVIRKRWALINFENPQIIEACDEALAKLRQAGESNKVPGTRSSRQN